MSGYRVVERQVSQIHIGLSSDEGEVSCWQGRWDELQVQAAGSLGSQAAASGQALLPSVKW